MDARLLRLGQIIEEQGMTISALHAKNDYLNEALEKTLLENERLKAERDKARKITELLCQELEKRNLLSWNMIHAMGSC